MKNMPQISVIVPVYNVEKELPACLDSILSQSLNNIEVIGVDDCSTDGSSKILKEYASRDERLKVISYEGNRGLSYARNRGIEVATGKYIMFVDSDDMITKDSLVELYSRIEEVQADGVMFDIESIYEEKINMDNISEYGPHKFEYPSIYTGQELFTLMRNNNDLQLMAWCCMWKREFLKKYTFLFHEGILHEDTPFSICAMLYAQSMIYIKKTCYIYRRRCGSITVKPYSYRNLFGLVIGNADVIKSMVNYNDKIDRSFCISISDFMIKTRKFVRSRLIDLIRHDENIWPFYSDDFLALMEWNNIANLDYVCIKGLMDPIEYKKIMKFKRVIVYGFGNVGREVVKLLEEFGISNYQIAVTEIDDSEYCDLSVHIYEIDELAYDFTNTLVLISVGEGLQDKLEKNAQNLGFTNIEKAKEIFK